MRDDNFEENENSWIPATKDSAWASDSGENGVRDDEIEIHVNLFIFHQQGSFDNKRAEDKHANGCSGISLNVSFE